METERHFLPLWWSAKYGTGFLHRSFFLLLVRSADSGDRIRGSDTGPETQTYHARELKNARDHWGSLPHITAD